MKWLSENWFRLSIVLVVALFCVIAIRYVYVQEQWHREQLGQQRRAYIDKRNQQCYNIFLDERRRFNNVEGPEYNPVKDVCRIRYNDTEKLDIQKCQGLPGSPTGQGGSILVDSAYGDCISNSYSKEF